MKFVEFIINLFLVITCHAFNEMILSRDKVVTWRDMLSFTNSDQTIYIDINNNNSVMFKNRLIKTLHEHNHSLILVSLVPEVSFGKTITLLKRNPNIVFTMKFLNKNILDHPLLGTTLTHWSALFILVTTKDSMFNCDHGFKEEAFNIIEEFLNVLWYKHRVMYVLLHLSYACPNKYIIYNGTKPTSGGLYNRTIQLVRGEQLSGIQSKKASRILTRNYPLRGNIFHRFPTAIQKCEGTDIYIKTSQNHSGGYCGIDGLVMSDIVSHFNFNLSLPIFPDSNKYGYQQQDGIITGSLGLIVRKDVDISFNSRFMTRYTTGEQQYTYIYHVAHDALCAVLKQPEEEPLWRFPINAYSLQQWIFILACLTSIGIIMWIFANIRNKMHANNRAVILLSYILNSINAGLFGYFFKRRRNLLLLRICCLYASIMVSAEYQSYINYMFTTRVRYDLLNSLSDLAESDVIIQTSPSIYTFINESINEVEDVLLSRTVILEDTDSFDNVYRQPHIATLDRQTDAIMLTMTKYTDATGKPALYVLDDCFSFFYLAYIANSDFPFISIVRIFILRLVETGLAKMYYTWTSRALGLEMAPPNWYSEPRPAAQITMHEQVIAFSVLLAGHVASVIVFVVEIGLERRRTYPFTH